MTRFGSQAFKKNASLQRRRCRRMRERRMEVVRCIVTAADDNVYLYVSERKAGIHYRPPRGTRRSRARARAVGGLLELNLMNCQVSGPRPAVRHAIFQSNILRGLSHCLRIMAPAVHACRADYVTYCNAWNAYKTKAIPRPRPCRAGAGGALPRQRFPSADAMRKRVEGTTNRHVKREKEEVPRGTAEIGRTVSKL